MRHLGKAVMAALSVLACAGVTAAQTEPANRPAPQEETTGQPLPKAPLPYSQPTPQPKPKPKPPSPPARPAAAHLAIGVQPLDAAELRAFVDGWLSDAMAREHVPGAAVAVVQNGQVVFKKGYGFADLAPRRPVDPDCTLFRLGAVSATFTWIELMRQVEAGRIRLDRPVNLYLPEKVRLPGKSRDLMVGNLPDHTGGFEDHSPGRLFENDPRRVRPLDLYLRQERPRRVRPAGIYSSYSDYGVALAGEASAFVSGKTFERLVEDDIALPLGMTRTTFREPRPERRGLPAAMPATLRADVARGYGWRAAGFMPDDYEYIGQIAPAGSASSTAGDMTRYMLMLLGNGSWNGVTVFGPQSARAFRTPLRNTPPGINGWAHGFAVYDLPGGHRGYGHAGHTIAFHTSLMVIPDLDLGIFVTTNSETGAQISDNLAPALVRHFYAPAQLYPRPGTAGLADAASLFDGYYLSTRRAYGGLGGFYGLLTRGQTVAVAAGGRLITHAGRASEAWVADGPTAQGRFLSAMGNERLVFQMKDGRATAFVPSGNVEAFQRASFWERPAVLIVLGALTAFAAVATLLGLALRDRRELRQNQIQARAAIVQNIQAGLWIAAFALFAGWRSASSDAQTLMYDWPGALAVTASTCALVAALLTLVTVAAAPGAWQGGRRVESWSSLRKVLFTTTVLIYGAFSILLAASGALEPWSG